MLVTAQRKLLQYFCSEKEKVPILHGVLTEKVPIPCIYKLKLFFAIKGFLHNAYIGCKSTKIRLHHLDGSYQSLYAFAIMILRMVCWG